MPCKSLSIVPGIPTTGKLNSCCSFKAPVNDPSPPITINPSISLSFKFLYAVLRPSTVLNSSHLAEYKNVPPLLIIPLTLLVFNTFVLFSIRPEKPLTIPIHLT